MIKTHKAKEIGVEEHSIKQKPLGFILDCRIGDKNSRAGQLAQGGSISHDRLVWIGDGLYTIVYPEYIVGRSIESRPEVYFIASRNPTLRRSA
ncbi:MAG: hypothetical protein AABW79_04365 [Nanoarchaeota archaeon]